MQVDDYVSGLKPKSELESQPLKGKKLGLVKETMGAGVDVSASLHGFVGFVEL